MNGKLTAFILGLLCLSARAQTSSLPPVQDHLSNPNVNAMVRDSTGRLWIGTSRGLNRYNGSAFKVYEQTDSLSLQDDYISCLEYDAGDRLWVGTGSGVELVRGSRVVPEYRWNIGRVFSMASMDRDHLLCSVRDGLVLLDKETGESRTVYQDVRLSFNSFIRTSGGYVWISHVTRPHITVLDPSFRVVRELDYPQSYVRHMVEGYDRSVYISTAKGLFRYTADGKPLSLPPSLEKLTAGENVLFYGRRPSSEMMVAGISGKGLYSVDRDVIRRILLRESLSDANSCMAEFSEECIWLSPGRQGVWSYFMPSDRESIPVPSDHDPEALNDLYMRDGNTLLILTNKDIYLYDRTTMQSRRVQADQIDGNQQILVSLMDSRSRFWMVYGYDELRRYEWAGDRLSLKFRTPVSDVVSLWESAEGNVHLLDGNRIVTVDAADKVSSVPASAHPAFWYGGQTRRGTAYFLARESIWVCGSNLVLSQLPVDLDSPECVWEDVEGIWWIGTRRQGLFRYNPATKELSPFPFGGAGSDHSIRTVTADGQGNIWVGTRSDVTVISRADGTALTFKSLPELNGVLSTNSCLVTPDNTVYFGNLYRIFGFSAQTPELSRDIPLSLDGILVNGETLMEDTPAELVLENGQRQVAFYFSGDNFDTSFRPVYQYRLDGFDTRWIAAGDNLRAGYSSLRPGKYTFRVRVQRQDGQWSEGELSQRIRVKPSPWLSGPMLLLYLLLALSVLGLGVYLFIRLRINRERMEMAQGEKLLSEQMAQERTNFFTNVSHEFRTPLSLIYGPVRELGKSASLSVEDRKMVGIVERNAERMIRLTDQLLQFNRSAASRDSLSVMKTDVALLLRQMLENFEYMFRQRSLHVKMELPQSLPVYCDREKVERIVFNLISNAVKYTPEQGSITVSAAEDEGSVRISVADTGIGISPEKMARVFDRFERVGEKVGDSLPTGFGIGLNYARHLALVHKGSLEVRGNDPLGSVFTFSFPSRREDYASEAVWEGHPEEESAPAAGVQPDSSDSGEVNVLIVEDNADMREYIRTLLGEKYRVMTASDGEQAWGCIRISAPDLIVSDIMMPFKDGYTLCKELKNDPEYCHIPVILLTAKADMENQIRGLELGADAYIGKPFDPQLLTASVKNLLDNRRRMQHILSERPSAVEEMAMSSHDKAFLEKLYALVEEHLGEEDFNVTTLALELGMSRTSLFSKLKALLGQSPQGFLMGYRLNKAMELLKKGDLNVSEVAYKVGFSTLTGFSRSFKNKFGVPPSSV